MNSARNAVAIPIETLCMSLEEYIFKKECLTRFVASGIKGGVASNVAAVLAAINTCGINSAKTRLVSLARLKLAVPVQGWVAVIRKFGGAAGLATPLGAMVTFEIETPASRPRTINRCGPLERDQT